MNGPIKPIFYRRQCLAAATRRPDSEVFGPKDRGKGAQPWGSARRRNLRSPSDEDSIRLMEEQFIHFPVRGEMELHPEALKLWASTSRSLKRR